MSKGTGVLTGQPCADRTQPVLTETPAPSGPVRSLRKRERREARIEPCEPVCIECGRLASHVKGDAIYPHRYDLRRKNFYLCECGAYVGCHPFTRIALGRPAGPLTRAARNRAHNCFDILWRRKMRLTGCNQSAAREAAYAWLGSALRYEPGKCHIGWMTAEEAHRVVAVCQPFVHPSRTPPLASDEGPATPPENEAPND